MDRRKNRYDRENIQRRVAAHVRDENKKKNANYQVLIDNKIRHQGKLFFESGLSLDEAPDEMRNNSVFVEGYVKARERKQEVYDLGVQSFINGVSFNDIPKIYQNNIDFMQGYNDALEHSMIDGIDWNNISREFLDNDSLKNGRHR